MLLDVEIGIAYNMVLCIMDSTLKKTGIYDAAIVKECIIFNTHSREVGTVAADDCE